MIDKKEENCQPTHSKTESFPDVADTTASILAESQQLLELTYCQVQSDIRASFERLSKALQHREKQLLRQLDVLQSQQIAILQSHKVVSNGHCMDLSRPIPQVQVDLQQERVVYDSIMSYGNVNVEGGNLATIDPYSAPYRLEDYQDANEDHVSLFKPLSNDSSPQEVIRFSLVPRLKPASEEDLNETKLDDSQSEDCFESITPHRASTCSLEDAGQSPQVKQWLQQIMAETESEPSVAELEKQFCAIATTD